jgi:uncharacterized membrane protein (DUF485 family)
MNNLTVLSMERKTFKRILKIAELLLGFVFIFVTLLCFIRFLNAEDVFDKVEYGIWSVILLILMTKE